ncbi:NADH-quinone oxidoreductase subunit M [Mucilaginibacter robiniae]|uniref:NADH-quinone oxidoreductase subunit M n=1 Tax=Mucilaginibacter robiniae TaxID=2728022 RepID=A0A7L5DW34_9SPHI|nr:NADH-quinone oxidoreductase subunit M [Mucilaginibacter robiniae]QJD95295.1 NADH-quinone oxidoreductase subunit M [Mucilaginibacter robiniae]
MTVGILLFFPLLAALALLFTKSHVVKNAALVASLIELALGVIMLIKFVPDASYQMVTDFDWVAKTGIHFKAGIDGISLIPVLLTLVLVPLIVVNSDKQKHSSAPAFYAFVLLMQSGLLMAFTAIDGFLFYVGWEMTLIPIYFINAIWGNEKRISVTLKFFIYTFTGSLFMLLAIIYLHLQAPDHSYDLSVFYNLNLSANQQQWMLCCFLLAFAVRMPLLPLQGWLSDWYAEAPTSSVLLLSGLMLQTGIYGAIRWMIPIVPTGFMAWQKMLLVLAVISTVYAAMMAFRQTDNKRLLAYMAMLFTSLMATGVLVWKEDVLQDTLVLMFNYGVAITGLTIIISIINQQLKSNNLNHLGIAGKALPSFIIVFLIIGVGTIALPLTSRYMAEFSSSHQYNVWLALMASFALVASAVHLFRLYQIAGGKTSLLLTIFDKITMSEKLTLGIISVLIVAIGVFPQLLVHLSHAAINRLITLVSLKVGTTI